MKNIKTLAVVLSAAIGVWVVLGSVNRYGLVHAMVPPPVTTDVRALPQRSDYIVAPLMARDVPLAADGSVAVTGQAAIAAAEARFQLQDSDIDPRVGAVQVDLSNRGDPRHQHQKVWIVDALVDTMSQGPKGSPHFIDHRLCIVVSATSGQYLFAYSGPPRVYVGTR